MTAEQTFVTALFRQRVRDVMGPPFPTVGDHEDCGAAVGALRNSNQQGVIVLGVGNRVLGELLERDVVDSVVFRVSPSTPVSEVMRSPVPALHQDDALFNALAALRQQGRDHLPVVDRSGNLVGTLYLGGALTKGMEPLLTLMDRISEGDSLDELKALKGIQVDLAEMLLKQRVPAWEIQSSLNRINTDVYRRVLARHLEELAEEGWGNPPLAFDLIVMGSGGRNESFLFPDQDNGFVLSAYEDRRHAAVDAYFIELARRTCRSLDAVGIPFCRGFVMATNPLWRKHIGQWKQQLVFWLRHPSSRILRLADIFFDFRLAAGDGRLAASLRHFLGENVPRFHRFLKEMQQVQKDHGVALGPFGQLIGDDTAGIHAGDLNLKYHGLLPMIEAVRLLALREGVEATSTLERIERLYEQGILDGDEHSALGRAFEQLTDRILRQQIADFKAKKPVGAFVPLHALSVSQREQLISSLKVISQFRQRVSTEFTGEL